jgi:hypothetical protein
LKIPENPKGNCQGTLFSRGSNQPSATVAETGQAQQDSHGLWLVNAVEAQPARVYRSRARLGHRSWHDGHQLIGGRNSTRSWAKQTMDYGLRAGAQGPTWDGQEDGAQRGDGQHGGGKQCRRRKPTRR